MTNPTQPTLADAKLVDAIFVSIGETLATRLTWLNNVYGKSQRLKEIDGNGQEIIYPGVYVGSQDYLKVFPDGHLGNFCFFEVVDGEEFDFNQAGSNFTTLTFAIVFWWDFRSVFPSPADWTKYTIDNVKLLILQALSRVRLAKGFFRIRRSYEQAENIYRGYTDREVDQQFLMRPYGGLRVEGYLKFSDKANC